MEKKEMPSDRITQYVIRYSEDNLSDGYEIPIPEVVDIRREFNLHENRIDSIEDTAQKAYALCEELKAQGFKQDMLIAQLQDTMRYHFGFNPNKPDPDKAYDHKVSPYVKHDYETDKKESLERILEKASGEWTFTARSPFESLEKYQAKAAKQWFLEFLEEVDFHHDYKYFIDAIKKRLSQ